MQGAQAELRLPRPESSPCVKSHRFAEGFYSGQVGPFVRIDLALLSK